MEGCLNAARKITMQPNHSQEYSRLRSTVSSFLNFLEIRLSMIIVISTYFVHFTVIPKKVKILNPPKMFQVDKEYRLVCLAEGSRPPPEITWKIGRYNIKSKVY